MIPNRPILWFLLFVPTFFLLEYFIVQPDYTLLGMIIFSVITGILALVFMYLGEKVRKKYFPNRGTKKNK